MLIPVYCTFFDVMTLLISQRSSLFYPLFIIIASGLCPIVGIKTESQSQIIPRYLSAYFREYFEIGGEDGEAGCEILELLVLKPEVKGSK